MAVGPGKYDELALHCLEETAAQGVVVIVLNGVKGSGISAKEKVCLGHPKLHSFMPKLLRQVAKMIEAAPDDHFTVG
jgi:hypothetical protein